MVHGFYETLLGELSNLLNIPKLKPDHSNTCLLKMISGVDIYIEMDQKEDFVLLVCSLGSPGAGRYREDLFRAAMKANSMDPPLNGILGYSDTTEQLMIFDRVTTRDLNGDRFMDRLAPFEEKAVIWHESIKNNEVPVVETVHTTRRMGMFGLG